MSFECVRQDCLWTSLFILYSWWGIARAAALPPGVRGQTGVKGSRWDLWLHQSPSLACSYWAFQCIASIASHGICSEIAKIARWFIFTSVILIRMESVKNLLHHFSAVCFSSSCLSVAVLIFCQSKKCKLADFLWAVLGISLVVWKKVIRVFTRLYKFSNQLGGESQLYKKVFKNRIKRQCT